MSYFKINERLTNENIPAIVSQTISAYKEAAGNRSTNETKVKLAVEEILINYLNKLGNEEPCFITLDKAEGKLVFTFRQAGPQENPIASNDPEDISNVILSRIGIVPKYTFESKKGFNTVTYAPEMKPNKNKTMYKILGALALAVICFFLMKLLPKSLQLTIVDSITTPIFTKMVAIITAIATPLVFLSVINGVAEIGDVNSLSAIGTGFVKGTMTTYGIAAAVFTGLALLFYPVVPNAASADGSVLKSIVQLVLDIIPNNLLQPFTIDNDLQVVCVAIFMAVALIIMEKKSPALKELMVSLSDLVNQMMTMAFKLIPAIVFLGIFNLLCGPKQDLSSLYILVLLYIISTVLVTSYITIRTCIKLKVPFKVLFKKQLATTMINLTTSSQVSALGENNICCKEKFGIDSKLVDFCLPLGVVIYMPNGAAFEGLVMWALANLAGIPISPIKVVLIAVMATIIAIAAPPIPGSFFAVLPIMMGVVNLPDTMYPIAIVLGTILGYFLPMFNGYCLQQQVLLLADKLDMVDRDILRKDI